ncbi:MAG: DUF5668 domain-containing protein [Bacillota bacterium]|nr:DUF5668 domain-containing protein [Bacillota bacterium]
MSEKKNGSIGAGIAFIAAGLFLIAYKFGFIDLGLFWSTINLWPLLLVVIGINMIFKKTPWIKALTWILFIAIVVLYSYYFDGNITIFGRTVGYDMHQEEYISEYDSSVEYGELKLDLGAGRLDVLSGDEYLIESKYPGEITEVIDSGLNNTQIFDYKTKNGIDFIKRDNEGYKYFFKLNKDIVWGIDIDMGAVDAKLDMRNIIFDDLDIDVGAGQLDLYLDKIDESVSIFIDSGVSNIDVYIPKDESVKLKYDGGIKDIDFVGDLHYEKEGEFYYSKEYSKDVFYFIDINTGVGNLSIREY